MKNHLAVIFCILPFLLGGSEQAVAPLQEYSEVYYMPLVYIPDPTPCNPQKGVAMVAPEFPDDLRRVHACYWYVWTANPTADDDPYYVPMSREGLFDLTKLPSSYDGFMLVFNEPNNVEPYGSNLTPQAAAFRYRAIRAAYPDAKMVVGNVSAWAIDWLIDFRSEIISLGAPLPEYWGVHGYVEAWIQPSHLIIWWESAHASLGGNFWITEFNDSTGNVQNLETLLDWMRSTLWVEKWFYFTNRCDPEAEYIPQEWSNFNLVDADGTLTEVGVVYLE